MPHERKRDLSPWLAKMLKFSPLVGMMGHRQVGKTTLAQQFSSQYVSFDKRTVLDAASLDPDGFLEQFNQGLVILDECQLCPPLFPALKERVRLNRKPGQFLLTGSVRFSSRKAIRESLTGRIVNVELLPFGLSEIHQLPLGDFIVRFMSSNEVGDKKNRKLSCDVDAYLAKGGLPGVLFLREKALRSQRLESQIETLLERDLRLILETSLSYPTLRRLFEICSREQGEPLDISAISRVSRISQPTIKKLLRAFEAMYLIRFLPCEGDLKKPTFYFEDAAEASHLNPEGFTPLRNVERFLFANLRPQLAYRSELGASLFSFRTRAGSFIPLCIRMGKSVLGILPTLESNPTANSLGSARAFLARYPNSKVLILSDRGNFRYLTKNILTAPLQIIL